MLVLAGGFLLWRLLGSPLALLESGYGQVLGAKLALVAALMALAALNRWRLVPQLAAEQPGARRRLAGSILAECLLAFAIVAATAVATTLLAPPR